MIFCPVKNLKFVGLYKINAINKNSVVILHILALSPCAIRKTSATISPVLPCVYFARCVSIFCRLLSTVYAVGSNE